MQSHPLSAALANAELIIDRATLDAAITAMAAPIARDYAGEVPVYLTVMHGALPFAGQLSLELGALGLDLEFDYLHATRYRGETTGGELVWKHRPATALYGRRVLLVDDILDEGYTLAAVRVSTLSTLSVVAKSGFSIHPTMHSRTSPSSGPRSWMRCTRRPD